MADLAQFIQLTEVAQVLLAVALVLRQARPVVLGVVAMFVSEGRRVHAVAVLHELR